MLLLARFLNLHPWQYDLLTADQFLAYCAEAERLDRAGADSDGG